MRSSRRCGARWPRTDPRSCAHGAVAGCAPSSRTAPARRPWRASGRRDQSDAYPRSSRRSSESSGGATASIWLPDGDDLSGWPEPARAARALGGIAVGRGAVAFPLGAIGVMAFPPRPRSLRGRCVATLESLGPQIGAVRRALPGGGAAGGRCSTWRSTPWSRWTTAGACCRSTGRRERTFGYAAEEMVGREVAELIVPPSLREAHRRRLARHLERGAGGPVVGRRVELTAMRADGTEFPVELVVTRPAGARRRRCSTATCATSPRATAPRRRCTGWPTSRPRCAGWRPRWRRSTTRRGCSRSSARSSGGCCEAQRGAHVPLRRRRRAAARSSAAGRCGAEHRLPAGTRVPVDGDTAIARVWRTGRAGADGRLRAAPRASWRRRCARYGVQAVVGRADLPRRPPVGRGDRLQRGPRAVPGGRRAADRRLRRAGRAGAGQRRARASSSPPRAPASSQAGDAERRRLERNLHDGAQQRLVSLALMLRLAARAAIRRRRRARARRRGALAGARRSCASWPAASTRRC